MQDEDLIFLLNFMQSLFPLHLCGVSFQLLLLQQKCKRQDVKNLKLKYDLALKYRKTLE